MDTRGTTYPGNPPGPIPERECHEKESPTGKCIMTVRPTYCVTLRTARSNQESAEQAYDRSVRLYYKKKELFEWTQHNYELYRDFDICVDSELTAMTTALTANVKTYSQLSQTLYTNLKKVVTAVADLKTKISALSDAAYNLDKYRNDQANASQWCLLTGKNVDNCKPEPEPHRRPEACHDADKIYDDLILMTKKVLIPDVNSLMQSASDTVGIQTFTNIDGLTTLQTSLGTATTALVGKIQSVGKTRRGDLDTCQTDLATAVQNCTAAGVNKYGMISVAHGEHCTVQFLCCPDCDCVVYPERPDILEPHLEKCECCICDIGEKIRSTYHHSDPPYWGPNGGHHHRDCGCSGQSPMPPIPPIR